MRLEDAHIARRLIGKGVVVLEAGAVGDAVLICCCRYRWILKYIVKCQILCQMKIISVLTEKGSFANE